jgi:cytochrome c oxidase cbb3-type subunit IV
VITDEVPTMDVNTLRTAVMVLSFACFAGIWAWAWARGNRARFAEAALLPFEDEATPAATREGGRS